MTSTQASHEIILLPGDGIGYETSAVVKEVAFALEAPLAMREMPAGADAIKDYGTPLPKETLDAIRKVKLALKGPITTPVGTGFRSVNVSLRKELDLYACLRPSPRLSCIGERYKDLDVVIVRENTEDLYAGIEFEAGSPETYRLIELCSKEGKGTIPTDSGISIKPLSISGTRRIVKYAFEYAKAHGRKKVTCVHKANIMKFSDGLFLAEARAVAREYEGIIAFDERIVDAFCMNMVMDPSQFDVVVLPNLYGDIASDLMAGMSGGLGIAPGANIGEDCAIFEAVHGSAPDIAGQDKANPTAEILSLCMLLEHIGEHAKASHLRACLQELYSEGTFITADIAKACGRSKAVGTREFSKALINKIQHS